MSVPYEEALSSLQQIVPSLDKEIIGIVLQSNGGHMEKTVEQLLGMAGEIPSEEVSYDPEQQLKAKQLEEDENFARTLQNEQFLRTLAATGNREFDVFTRRNTANAPTRQKRNVAEVEEQDPILEGLKKLGESARLKFRELAQKFERLDQNADNVPQASYKPLATQEDTAEVVTLDTSLNRRGNISFFDSSDEDDEFSLTKTKGQTGLIHKSATPSQKPIASTKPTSSQPKSSPSPVPRTTTTSNPSTKQSGLVPSKKKAE